LVVGLLAAVALWTFNVSSSSVPAEGVARALTIDTARDKDDVADLTRVPRFERRVVPANGLPLVFDAAALQWLLLVLGLSAAKREVVAYLIVENRLLRRQLGTRRVRLTDRRPATARRPRCPRRPVHPVRNRVDCRRWHSPARGPEMDLLNNALAVA
jgi:hypothetical protein